MVNGSWRYETQFGLGTIVGRLRIEDEGDRGLHGTSDAKDRNARVRSVGRAQRGRALIMI
jgi:hypothetical protein